MMSNERTELSNLQYTNIWAELEHLDPQTIRAYVQEKITNSTELDRIERHVFDCEECRTEFNFAFDAYSPYKAAYDAFAKRTETKIVSDKSRLIDALGGIASGYTEWQNRLLQWRDQLLKSEDCFGASLTVVFPSLDQESYPKVLPSLSSPKIVVAHSSASHSRSQVGKVSPETRGDLIIAAENWLNVKVKVEDDSITLEFIEWPQSAGPLVVLIPEDDIHNGRLPDSKAPNTAGDIKVYFDDVPLGSYLLSIAPIERSSIE